MTTLTNMCTLYIGTMYKPQTIDISVQTKHVRYEYSQKGKRGRKKKKKKKFNGPTTKPPPPSAKWSLELFFLLLFCSS